MINHQLEEQLELIGHGAVDLIGFSAWHEKLKNGIPLRIKAGFDPTSPNLHLGHAVLLTKLRQFQDMGHHIIFLIGDFTGRIGYPSGLTKSRPILTDEVLRANMATYHEQVTKVLLKERMEVVFNSDWLSTLNAADIVQLCSQYTLARMLERDDFSNRYQKQLPISLHEFLYPLFQGYDSLALKAEVELGGTDQLFNLLVGRELQRSAGMPSQAVLTMPILEGLDGVQKMSKSLDNVIHIADSPIEMFGKIMSISDDLMWRYYELLSLQTLSKVDKLRESTKNKQLNPRSVKVDLARELVVRYCGKHAAQLAEEDFSTRFQKQDIPDKLVCQVLTLDANVIPRTVMILKILELTDSLSEAFRMITQGAVRRDGIRISDVNNILPWQTEVVLQIGRRKFAKVFLKNT